jgi:hypothetical protein
VRNTCRGFCGFWGYRPAHFMGFSEESGYFAAQVIIVSTIFGTRNSMTEPPRFLPIASMSPDLNLRAAIPIKKGVAAIIAVGPLHPISSETAHGVCELLGGT